jgi:alpha-L-fucosidase 2
MSNHLDLTESYTNFLWRTKKENEAWTKRCFAIAGLNVPGVTTISGKAMGGWIQYSLSPTTVCWLAQHFYWQWKYSMSQDFFYHRLKPYFNEVVTYLQNVIDQKTHQLPLSSSPEFNDNKISAWFKSFTNYDLALCKYVFAKENEIRLADTTARERKKMLKLNSLPDFNTDETGLTVAPGQDLDVSHRHMSPYMAIYPLCLLDIERPQEAELITRSLRHLESLGTREWCGYSFSWMASLYARAKLCDSAVRQLQIFATNFCSPNSFHLNGDQRGGQYSSFTYSPFTLEGNFAFAQGIHELLLQVHNDVLEIFPAVPQSWKTVSFHTLRTEGAFLVSASKENGKTISVRILSAHGGKLKIKMPFSSWTVIGIRRDQIMMENDVATMNTIPGQTINFAGTQSN